MDTCQIPRCRRPYDLIYLSRRVCDRHWDRYMSEEAPPDALRKALGMAVANEGGRMQDEQAPETPATEEEKMPKRTRKAKAPKKAKAPSKRSVAATNGALLPLVVRVDQKTQETIYKAAEKALGPRKAGEFIKLAALAAAKKDVEAFKELCKGKAGE